MTDKPIKDLINATITEIYYEFSHSVNHLVILREFFKDLLNIASVE